MRRSQSTRNQGKTSLALGVDDLEVLRESGEEGAEDLRQQLREKNRENEQVSIFNDVSETGTRLSAWL